MKTGVKLLRERTGIHEAAQAVDDSALVVHASAGVEFEADARAPQARDVREPHEAIPEQAERRAEQPEEAQQNGHEAARERDRLRRRERLPERAQAAVRDGREPRDPRAHQRHPRGRRGGELRGTAVGRGVRRRASAERQPLRGRPGELHAWRI